MGSASDWARISEAMAAIREMNAIDIVLRRGTTTLAAQRVRIERQGTQARAADSAGAEQVSTAVVILGAIDLDIQPQDRFTLNGQLYEVTLIRPNRLTATQAEARVIE